MRLMTVIVVQSLPANKVYSLHMSGHRTNISSLY